MSQMWTWLASQWAKVRFGEYAGEFLKLMEAVASVLSVAFPIVRALEAIKSQWSGGHSDHERLVELIKEKVPGEPHPGVVVSQVYDQRHVGETLFGVAVWLFKQQVPSSAKYAKLAVELAYLLIVTRKVFRP